MDEETVALMGKVTWLKVPGEGQAWLGWGPGPWGSEEEVTYFSLS